MWNDVRIESIEYQFFVDLRGNAEERDGSVVLYM